MAGIWKADNNAKQEEKTMQHDLSKKEALLLVRMATDRADLARLLALPTAALRRRIEAEKKSPLKTRDAIRAISEGVRVHHMQPAS